MKRFFTLLLFLSIYSCINAQFSNNITLLGTWDDDDLIIQSGVQFNDIWGYATGDQEFAIIGSREKVHFIEVTDPTQITEIAAITGGANSLWRDIKTFGNYAYSVADQGLEGLSTFDLSAITDETNPMVTRLEQRATEFTSAHNLFIDVDHGFLYVVGANTDNADIIIYDLNTTPGSPTHLETVSLPGGYIHDVYVKNHVAYCSHGNDGLYVYNLCGITDPTCSEGEAGTYLELGRLESYQHQGYNHSSWTKGNYIFFADETHGKPLKVLDATDLADMQVIDFFQSNQLEIAEPTSSDGSIPHNPFIIGNLCVVSYYHDGVVFYDVTDPANVTEVGYYDTETTNDSYSATAGCWGVYPYLPSGRIIASDKLNGLFVLGMSASLTELATSCGGVFCDDNDASTFNDMEDENCNCVGTPCPTAGMACDDGDDATIDDIEDGNCNCLGTIVNSVDDPQGNSNQYDWNTYPNPAGEYIIITISANNASKYTIKDILGRTVLSSHLDHTSKQRVSIDQLQAGCYFLSIEFNDGQLIAKPFVKG